MQKKELKKNKSEILYLWNQSKKAKTNHNYKKNIKACATAAMLAVCLCVPLFASSASGSVSLENVQTPAPAVQKKTQVSQRNAAIEQTPAQEETQRVDELVSITSDTPQDSIIVESTITGEEEAQPVQDSTEIEDNADIPLDAVTGGMEMLAEDNTEEVIIWAELEFTQELVPGAENQEVSILQLRLMDLGYMEEDEATMLYGPQTELAVRCFERVHGLEITGIAVPEILEQIMSEEAQGYIAQLGDEGEDIKSAQQNLSMLKYELSVNGQFDDDTQTAVAGFQAMNDMKVTGIINKETRVMLSSEDALNAEGVLRSEASGAIDALIAVAGQNLGKPYSLGAKGPNAFDCSGFVYYCLNQSGYGIGYMTSSGWAGANYPTVYSMDELLPGDIVCFTGHVGIYIGDGLMMDASTSENRTKVSSDIRTTAYWANSFICGKRLF